MVFAYEGPVYEFNQLVAEKWKAETTAVTKVKAISNLAYRWKKENNKPAYTPVKLTGQVKEIKV